MNLQETINAVRPVGRAGMDAVAARFDSIAIPLGSLGLLQDAIAQLGGIQGTDKPSIERRAVVAFCADNGVVRQGVTQCGQEITALVTENMGKGVSAVCLMAKRLGMDMIPVDIGVAADVRGERIVRRKIAYGTKDMTEEPAMTRDEAVRALETGIEMAERCAEEGYGLLCAGEMGIGNTTTSAAVTAALTGEAVEAVTGRGAGLSSEGLQKKIAAIQTALDRHKPDRNDPIDVLAKVGGFDIGGMAGLYLGAAAHRIPVMLDGVIGCVAALIAARLCPAARGYLLASHQSEEPAGKILLRELDARPFITAGMRLGEGTGAAAGVALLDRALSAYLGMPTFEEIGMEAYEKLV